MKKSEVPQDKSNLASKGFTDLYYAVDKEGNYTTMQSSGWTPKTEALDQSLDYIDQRIADYKKQVIEKNISPIPYYMEINRMDLIVLADYMGKWQWTVKRHFKLAVFKHLSEATLAKYAKTFNISVEKLKDITL